MTDIPHLHRLLPHETPMVLIDDLVDVGEEHVHCQVCIREDNLFFDHQTGSIPGWVGIEFMAQAIAGWSGFHAWKKEQPSPIGFLLGSRRYKADSPSFTQGTTLDIYADRVMEGNGMASFSCRIESQGEVLASGQLNVYVPKQEKLNEIIARNDS